MAKFFYYLFVKPLSYLPLRALYLFANLFYFLLITVFPYRKKVILKNLYNSFPDKNSKEIHKLKRKFYRHFADLMVEGVKNLSLSKKELSKRLKVRNPEIMKSLYKQNQSVILVSGHYNNWEWLIRSQNFLFPHQAMGIGMPMSNKTWDNLINKQREKFGMQVVHAKNFHEKIKFQKDPIAILLLADQSPGNSLKSYWMKFLNQQTAVLFGAEKMAHDNNYAVVGFVIHKVKRGFYEIELTLITDNPSECKWGEITEAHTKLLENAIISKPEYWIWSHKRWKRDIPKNLEEIKLIQEKQFSSQYNLKN